MAEPIITRDSGRSTLRSTRATVVASALALGMAGDLLLRAPGPLGLNGLVLFAMLGVAIVQVAGGAGRKPSLEARALVLLGVLFASGLVWRDAWALRVLSFLSASVLFALPAYRAGASWLRRSGVAAHLEALVGATTYAGLGVLRMVFPDDGSVGPRSAPSGADGATQPVHRARLRGVVRGVALAVPLLLVFGALFVSADRVFAEIVSAIVREEMWERILSHVLLTAVLAWLACGFLFGVASGTRLREMIPSTVSRPGLGILEVGIVVGLVDLLFLAFVLVQLRYLFGGAGLVEVTPGLTYAEYAREGFEQLVVAAALVLPSLLAADWLLRRRGPADDLIFRALGGLQVLLLGVVVASAVERVRAYQSAYGLTESRFYASAFLAWLVLASVWFAATVLRGRRDRFALPTLASGLGLVAVLLLVNPDARIARTNLARAAETQPLDADHLGSLGADAVPTLLASLESMPAEARCRVARRLLDRWGPEVDWWDWRSWNLSVARARGAVAEAGPVLNEAAGAGEDCA